MIRAAVLALLLAINPTQAAWHSVQQKSSAAGVTYAGPGNVVAGATAWWGLRAYSAAVAATGTQKAVTIRRASDQATSDILILTSGALDVATATTFCASTTCSVTTWYDQTTNGHNAVQATAGQQPVLSLSGCSSGSLPCLSFLIGSSRYLGVSSSGLPSQSQPYTISAVAVRSASFTTQAGIFVGPTSFLAELEFYSVASTLQIYAGGGTFRPAATDSVWHSISAVFNGALSAANVDGTVTSSNPNTLAHSAGTSVIGAGTTASNFLTGAISEVGFWPAGFTAQNQTDLCHQQIGYWGISGSC